MASLNPQNGKTLVRLHIEAGSDDQPYWHISTKYMDLSDNLYDVIGEEELGAFEPPREKQTDIVLMVEDILVPESYTVGDLNPRDRSGVVLTRRSIEAKVKRTGFSSMRVVVENGFTFRKLKQMVEERTGIEVGRQHMEVIGEVENRKSRALGNLEGARTEIGLQRFRLTLVDPLTVSFRSELNDRDTSMTVSPKMTSQRLVQNMEIESQTQIDPSDFSLLFQGIPLLLTSPYAFICATDQVNSTLEGYGVQNNDTLVFRKRDISATVRVKLISGTIKTIEGFDNNDYVGDIMWQVAKQNEWNAPDLMRLLWGTQRLDHTKRLSDYAQNVPNDAMIHMVPTMRRL